MMRWQKQENNVYKFVIHLTTPKQDALFNHILLKTVTRHDDSLPANKYLYKYATFDLIRIQDSFRWLPKYIFFSYL